MPHSFGDISASNLDSDFYLPLVYGHIGTTFAAVQGVELKSKHIKCTWSIHSPVKTSRGQVTTSGQTAVRPHVLSSVRWVVDRPSSLVLVHTDFLPGETGPNAAGR